MSCVGVVEKMDHIFKISGGVHGAEIKPHKCLEAKTTTASSSSSS